MQCDNFCICTECFKRWSVDDPGGIVIDPKGNVYVAETGKNRILEFTSNGTLIRARGSAGSGNGQWSI
ncbi:MAG: hypothetical protein JO297_08185 [Nitrososphaeraceae archaeon]|nr:hypothetical protein [Nitrososphaeraceae archaeon]